MSQEDIIGAINEVLAKDERALHVSPLMKEVAEAQLAGLEESPIDGEWENWKMGEFRKSPRNKRIEILNKWNARRHANGLWADRQRELEELHELLERAGR
jgi:hypothetical protein